uniref:RNA-directed RNA polymerase L n=1 Tax=Mamucuso virus TaxID=2838394 RepID=A0A8E6Z7X9_9VIRU|nr:RNA-dependent RNA polymerase [Mamucuso virus]
MDQLHYLQIKQRIDGCHSASLAKDINTDILISRHDYFGREICKSLNIEYRIDFPLIDILLEVLPSFDPLLYEVPVITPDNYLYMNGKLFIIDYKVSASRESSIQTMSKYKAALDQICLVLNISYEIVIIRANPITNEVTFSNDEFRNNFMNIQIDLDFSRFLKLKQILFDKFSEDEEFLLMISHSDFTITTPWCKSGVKELKTHPIYREFMNSMPIEYQELFEDSLRFNAHNADRWNEHLIKTKSRTENYYNEYVKKSSSKIFMMDGQYSEPNEKEIDKGWSEMSERVSKSRNLSNNVSDQKPSGHFLWTNPDLNSSNNNIEKILKLSKALQNIKEPTKYTEAFKALGACFDFSEEIGKYNQLCLDRKQEARKHLGKVMNKKIDPVIIGKATVYWEQQFGLNNRIFEKNDRLMLTKEFLGIGNHILFKNKTGKDLDLDKPKILDFNSDHIYLESKRLIESTKNLLSQSNNLDLNKDFIYSNFHSNIESASSETGNNLESVIKSCYWSSLNDISVLMKNMLSVSQYNRHNTFRIATCQNNNVFGLVFPSADIKTKRATMVYVIIVLHNDKESLFNPGALYHTYKSGGKYVSISKAMRLDKERCQRIIAAPGLFLTTSLLFKYYSVNSNIHDIMAFSYFTSISITKSLLTLTEPARYMIMNSLATSSHAREYIAEKFSPLTKTLFSVYVTRLIKNACYKANKQREHITLRNISLTDFEITQKGVDDNKDFDSIWFSGKVSLKGYINQVYLPFYFNAKGLHEKHHVLVDLAKTVLEIERDQRLLPLNPWQETLKKESVNLEILIHSISKNLLLDTSRHSHLRSKIESRNNFNRSITTISTFTSSKSCIKLGDFQEFKEKKIQEKSKSISAAMKRHKVANPLFALDELQDLDIQHSNYNNLRACVPKYTDFVSTKVFDRLYEMLKEGLIDDSKSAISNIMDTMKSHKLPHFAFFNKGQKTAKDREIFVGEFESKMCLYGIERIAKERCKLNPDEMISEPGDNKLKALELKAEQEIRFIIEQIKQKNPKMDLELLEQMKPNYKATKIEINADMSKWSAQDVLFKYFWLFALDPILYPEEKERIIYFLCNYMNKRLLLPDELVCNILDQKVKYANDIILEMTNNLHTNSVEIKRNWLQGNLNYTSSYVHSCAMSLYKDILKEVSIKLEAEVLVNSMVHSDDNHTSIVYIHDRFDSNVLIQHSIEVFEETCLSFGCQANMKKTYFSNVIKEFVSLFCISGEPFSIFGRFLLTSVGDCAYIGPYEDMASRLSSTQTAIKHGCPPSLAWVSIAINHWITFMTYNMLPGQVNDPMLRLPANSRDELPIELFGILKADLSTIALIGLEAGNLTFLIDLLNKYTDPFKRREPVALQASLIKDWELNKLTDPEIFKLKILRYLVLDSEMDLDSIMGETSDMRGRSLITPRKFTTIGSLKKLRSFCDYQETTTSNLKIEELYTHMLQNPELLVTKGENKEDYMATVLYRYNSKKFKESLSIQNPSQLFIEQVLFSHKPVIDYNGIRDKYSFISDALELEDRPEILGRLTFNQTYEYLSKDLAGLPLTLEDISLVYQFMILNDPLLITVANSLILKIRSIKQQRTGVTCNSMPELRSIRLIHHSPALVLRAYTHNKLDIPGSEPEEMQRDLVHLKEFIDQTNIKVKMEERINLNEKCIGHKDLAFELKEYTRFYQTCYDYIKSTEHKIKIFILPVKCYTAVDFCASIQGNLIEDNSWTSIHYLRNILSGGFKTIVQKTNTNELNVAIECFRLLCYFTDLFVNKYSKKSFINGIIETFTYKEVTLRYLFSLIKDSHLRYEFLPLLNITDHLEQRDLDKYDAMKSNEAVTWNNWQVNRSLQTGPIDLKISGLNKNIRILGEDTKLHIAELSVTRDDKQYIIATGRRLLSTRHGLHFENLDKVKFIPEANYYITYQRKNKYQYSYQIHDVQSINQRNEDNKAQRTRIFNEIVPVCPIIIAKFNSQPRVTLKDIYYLNYDNLYASKLKVSTDEYAIMRRAGLHKMQNFDGPSLKSGLIDFTQLMKVPELLSTNFEDISKGSLLSFSRVISCTGNKYQDTLEFLSDEPMEMEDEVLIESVPLFTVTYRKKANSTMTYREAIRRLIQYGTEDFEKNFSFANDGFVSNKNLGILEIIVSLLYIVKRSDWSDILLNCLHIAIIKNGMDNEFHNFNLPNYFFTDVINYKIDWVKIKQFILSLPEVQLEPWLSIINDFQIRLEVYTFLYFSISRFHNIIFEVINNTKPWLQLNFRKV